MSVKVNEKQAATPVKNDSDPQNNEQIHQKNNPNNIHQSPENNANIPNGNKSFENMQNSALPAVLENKQLANALKNTTIPSSEETPEINVAIPLANQNTDSGANVEVHKPVLQSPINIDSLNGNEQHSSYENEKSPTPTRFRSVETQWSNIKSSNYFDFGIQNSQVAIPKSQGKLFNQNISISPDVIKKSANKPFVKSVPTGKCNEGSIAKSDSAAVITNTQKKEFMAKLKQYLQEKAKILQFTCALKQENFIKGVSSPSGKSKLLGNDKEKCPFDANKNTYHVSIEIHDDQDEEFICGLNPQEQSLYLFATKLAENAGKGDSLVKAEIVEAIQQSKDITYYFNIRNISSFCSSFMNINSDSTITWKEYVNFLIPFHKPFPQIPLHVIHKSRSVTSIHQGDCKQNESKDGVEEVNQSNKIAYSKRPNSSSPNKTENRNNNLAKLLSSTENRDKNDFAAIKCTIPIPFTFNDREKSMTIRQMKLLEMQKEREVEESNLIHHVFKAKPVPAAVSLPKYDMIMEANQKRREEVRTKSKEITKSREKPFSFYEKDIKIKQEKQKMAEDRSKELGKIPAFKANQVPPTVKNKNKWQEIQATEDIKREERINKRKEEMRELSKLPPRMEMHKQEEINKPQKAKEEEHFVYKASDVPDFKKLQEAFTQKLEAKKKEKTPTIPINPKFHEIKKSSKPLDFLDNDGKAKQKHEAVTEALMKQAIYALKKPAVNPRSTIKTEAMFERRRKELEDKRAQEEAKEREESERHRKQNQVGVLSRCKRGCTSAACCWTRQRS